MLAVQQQGFWQRLAALCGHSYPGRMTEGDDSVFLRHRLVARVHSCTAEEVRIGFAFGGDSSRTWVVRRGGGVLRLRHEVRAEDGTEERISGYGGMTLGPGTVRRQEFAADSATARLLPQAAQNRWLLELVPGRVLAYTLGRPGSTRRFRLEFDLGARR
jgi:hypothetical protein